MVDISPQIAKRMAQVRPSATIAAAGRAAELRRAGKEIISLGAGEPDFDTPAFIVEAAKRAMDEGKTRYAPAAGIPQLREAIAHRLEQDKPSSLSFSPDNVVVTCGAKQAIYNALVASLNPGDEVLIPAPYWVSYPDMVALAGGVAVVLETRPEENFCPTADRLQQAITERSRWLILNSPSNPTGALYTRAQMEAIGKVVANNPQLCVISDEIYEHLVYDGKPFVSFLDACPHLASRTLLVSGVSKTFVMTGWRIGYAYGDLALIKAMTTIQSQSASSATTFCQWAAIAALESDMSFFIPMLDSFNKRRRFLTDALNDIEGLSCNYPDGAFYVFPSCAPLIGRTAPDGTKITNDQSLTLYALEQAGVAMVHGAAFGAEPYLRCSYATSNEDLDGASRRLKDAFAKLS